MAQDHAGEHGGNIGDRRSGIASTRIVIGRIIVAPIGSKFVAITR